MKLPLDRLHEFPVVCLDMESTGLHWYRDSMFGVAVGVMDDQRRITCDYFDIRQQPRILEILRQEGPLLRRVVNHNIKIDAHFLRVAGVELPHDRIECTSVRAALINEHELSFSLDALCKKCIGMGKDETIYAELAELFGGKPTRDAQMRNLHRAPVKLAHRYAIRDPELAIRLWLWQEDEIKKQGLEQVWSLERRLTPVLIDIERHGIRIDKALTERSVDKINRLTAVNQKSLNRLAGAEVNANSPKQVAAVLGAKKNDKGVWVTESGYPLSATAGGAPSVDKDALIKLTDLGDKRASAIQAVRKSTKALSFLTEHILAHEVKGRVHPNYNQTRGESGLGTGTGRLSIDDPAMQQIPARDVEIATIVRACFVPEADQAWCSADWEQFEFRWFAHYTKDEKILAQYMDDPHLDYHAAVAAITGIPRNPRYAGDANAKQINLGLVFGMGPGTMAAEMGLDFNVSVRNGIEYRTPGDKAKEIFATYHAAIPGVKALLEQASSIARSRGHVITAHGRHIRFPGGKFTHKAGGLVFQGTSADCMKLKMIELHTMSKALGFQYLLSVHDEHNCSIPKGKPKLIESIKRELQNFELGSPIHCRVPILSSVKTGINWWEACKK